jgi:hypothetical protein
MSRTAYVVGFAIASAACAHHVRQDAASGPDGRQAGARIVRVDHGTATLSGIVTYPGGDRVDWAEIALPEHERGTLHLKLTWTPPRPGLQLAFDVYDAENQLVASAANRAGRSAEGQTATTATTATTTTATAATTATTTTTAAIDRATGSYYVRIYAVERGDAGTYRLSVRFRPAPEPAAQPEADVPPPPLLAAVPDPDVPCPTPPDPAVLACRHYGEPSWQDVVPRTRPPVSDLPAPVTTRIVRAQAIGSWVVITIGAGKQQGVTSNWKATVLHGDTDLPLDGGEIELVRIEKSFAVGKSHLTVEQLADHPRVRLTPQ